jgi:hypothetical protein
MIQCPRCKHQNLPGNANCSVCGTPLVEGASATGGDEYARLVVTRAAAAKRQKQIIGAITAAVLAVGGFVWYRDHAQKKDRQEKLDFFERWAELDRRETGAFFACAMASEVDMNAINTAQQVQQRMESAYFTQQATFSEHLLSECVPKADRARQAFSSIKNAPAEMAPALQKYSAALPKLQTGIEDYATKIKDRKGTKDTDQLIQEHGNAWHSASSPTPEAVAFEKFMHCAIPGLGKMKDAQAMLEFMADACFKKDPVAFMDRVRKDCGSLLADVGTKATPSKTWRLSQQKFADDEARQLRAWDSCSRKSRKGKKADDLAEFLVGVGEYMEARSAVVKAARAIQGS